MSGGSTNSSLRKALGSIKDTTTISLAKVNSGYKELDIAIVRATNHVERPAKEKHIRAIFSAVSAVRPRADVAYCIHALARRLSKTHNWAVALKTLIVIHRALREVDPSFQEELINYERGRNHMLNMAHFKDDSSATAWDYSAWVRCYALYLEERLECFRVLKYDVETERSRTKDLDTVDLLDQLPALQQLLFRAIGCQPEGAAMHNFVIQLALSMVAAESMKIYNAIGDGTVNLVDKFFEMQHQDAIRALDIYRRSGQQAERLSEFYEVCKNLDLGRGERFIKIEQTPASFLQAMEEYVRDVPRGSTFKNEQVKRVISEKDTPKEILAIEYKKDVEAKEDRPPSPVLAEPVKEEKIVAETPDLLNWDDPAPASVVSDLDEKNGLALAIVSTADPSTTAAPPTNLQNGTTGWELALVTAPTSNEPTTTTSKLAGGFDLLTLDSLYNDAIRRNNQPVSHNPWEPAPMTNPMMQQQPHDPFFASHGIATHTGVQMSNMSTQQQAFMLQQQQMQMSNMSTQQAFMLQQQQMMMMGQQPYGTNPYGTNPFGSGMPVQAYNPYAGYRQ